MNIGSKIEVNTCSWIESDRLQFLSMEEVTMKSAIFVAIVESSFLSFLHWPTTSLQNFFYKRKIFVNWQKHIRV